MVFVDTWAWLALALRRDQHHADAKRRHAEFVRDEAQYVTTDYMICELITQIFRDLPADQAEAFIAAIMAAVDSGQYRLEQISPQRFTAAWQMRRQYHDKPTISFVDLTSFVVMRERQVVEAFTGDAHFSQVNLGFQVRP